MKQVTALAPGSDLLTYYSTAASDVYFQRAQRTLAGAHVDAGVAMDFFAGRPGVLCGVAEAVRLLTEVLQEGDEAYAIAEGAAIGAKETALRVRAPYSRFGVYETALLGMLSSCTGWATAAREVVDALGKRLRGVRLDTPGERGGVTVDLVKEVRARLDGAGHSDVGIFVSGGLDAERIRQFESAKCPIHSYGVGMAISSAPPIAF